jgi:hypothetical protein
VDKGRKCVIDREVVAIVQLKMRMISTLTLPLGTTETVSQGGLGGILPIHDTATPDPIWQRDENPADRSVNDYGVLEVQSPVGIKMEGECRRVKAGNQFVRGIHMKGLAMSQLGSNHSIF